MIHVYINFPVNQFVYFEHKKLFYVQVKKHSGKTAILQTPKELINLKNNVRGAVARNREQNFALNLLMNLEVNLVTILGQAGTGKTFLTLAAGLMQTLITRAGPATKVASLGNITQIDTPYLTEGSSSLVSVM